MSKELTNDDKYKALFMASRDAVMTLEPPSWRFTSGNPATIKMFKAKDEAEFLSCEPWKLSPSTQPDGRPSDEKAKEMIEKAMKEGVNLFEWVHKRVDGEEFFAEVLLSRVEQGGKTFLYASVRDITERKEIQNNIEKLNKVMIGRELAMKELKQKIAELESKKT
ncbi:MAG: PAS domain S-box protein [bacterium]|nr:PAS domain S-box protein [bacterium]